MISNTNLFKTLDALTKQYLIKEANDEEELPFPTGAEEDQGDEQVDTEVEMDINEPQADDPTETPEPGDIPQNEDGAFISDTKLAMFANLLLKAFMAPPSTDIPENLQNVTANNAAEVISFIESRMNLQKPTDNIVADLSKI